MQMQLPTRFGGLGLRPLTIISLVAYLGSLAASASEILSVADCCRPALGAPLLLPSRYEEEYMYCRDSLILLAPVLETMVFVDVSDAVDALNLVCLPTTLLEFLQTFQQHPDCAMKFQRRLSLKVWERQAELCEAAAGRLSVSALHRLLSYYAQDAGRIWNRVPDSSRKRLQPAHAQHAARLQFGALPEPWMYLHDGPLICRGCRKVDIKAVPGHFLHCESLRRSLATQRHDAVALVLQSAAHQNGVPTEWSPFVAGSSKVCDIAFHLPAHSVLTDVTIVAADAPSRAGLSEDTLRNDPVHAANLAAGAKVSKYQAIIDRAGSTFVPLAFTTAGGYTKKVADFIVSIEGAGEDNCVPIVMEADDIRDLLAVVIQRGNALMNMAGSARMRADSPAYQLARAAKRRLRAASLVQRGGVAPGRVGVG